MESIITHTTDIAGPRARVWEYLDDPEKQKLWMKGVEGHEVTHRTPERVGSRFVMKIREGRKLADYRGEVTVYDELTHLAVRLEGGCMPSGSEFNVDYHLTDLGGGQTRLEYRCTLQVRGFWMRILAFLFRPMAKMQLRSFMKRLKALVETPQLAVG